MTQTELRRMRAYMHAQRLERVHQKRKAPGKAQARRGSRILVETSRLVAYQVGLETQPHQVVWGAPRRKENAAHPERGYRVRTVYDYEGKNIREKHAPKADPGLYSVGGMYKPRINGQGKESVVTAKAATLRLANLLGL